MTIDINDTDAKNYIMDDTSTYRLYLKDATVPSCDVKMSVDYTPLEGGVIQVITSTFKLSGTVKITTGFTTNANWIKFLAAWGWWLKNKSKLTLYLETDAFGTNNIYKYPTYAEPTTLTNFTGVIPQFTFPRGQVLETTLTYLVGNVIG